jgi:hypothetical protein
VSVDAKSREILVQACQGKIPVFFAGDGLGITFQTFILRVDEHQMLVENRVKPRYVRRLMGSARFSLQARMVRFQASSIGSDGQHILFPLKEDSVIEETRQSERFAFTADERVICEILNPFDGETKLSKNVMDMSATGLSLRTTLESKLFDSGTELPSVRVLIDGEPYTLTAGKVVYNRKMIDLAGQLRLQVGIKFNA